jgi:hypothetical protein
MASVVQWITDSIFSVLNLITLFFQSLFSPGQQRSLMNPKKKFIGGIHTNNYRAPQSSSSQSQSSSQSSSQSALKGGASGRTIGTVGGLSSTCGPKGG